MDNSGRYSFETQGIGLNSIVNARELGGYRMPDGSLIKRGKLLRGGALNRLSPEDLKLLTDRYHLSRIFDFRTSFEVKRTPDMEIPGANRIWLPAFDEDSMQMEKLSLPSEAYRDLVSWLTLHASEKKVQEVARDMYTVMITTEFTQVQYAGFFLNILNSEEGAVYWHCSQGKDRTGLGAALMLAALGADRKLIMEDYEISNEVYRQEVEEIYGRLATEEEKEAALTFIGVNSKYFSAALDKVEEQYGSLLGFLKGPICLSEEDIRSLRERFLE